jgi:lipopolysaccharide transport system ATP-binding protein
MSEIAIHSEHLGKCYRVGAANQMHGSLRESLAATLEKPYRALRHREHEHPRTLWALREVAFDVGWGEVLGIIGRNGAGKSTLLKILSRVTYPTTGSARLYGRVGSLLEVGTGFHLELTGRENIFLNGAILGMRKREIQRKFDAIVDFAEVHRFLDTPVKRYSSGMYMRLAFAVAAHLDPEILLVDEVLAVGDAAFQKKCLTHMGDAARSGRTIVFVSHNMAAVKALCNRVLWVEQGRILAEDSPTAVVERYLESGFRSEAKPLEEREDRLGDGSARIVSLTIESAEGGALIRPRSPLFVRIGYRSDRPVKYPKFLITICDQLDTGLFMLHSEFANRLPDVLPPEGIVTCRTDSINLTPGRCIVHAELLRGNARADFVSHAAHFDVEHDDVYGTGMVPPREWVRYILDQQWGLDGASQPGVTEAP